MSLGAAKLDLRVAAGFLARKAGASQVIHFELQDGIASRRPNALESRTVPNWCARANAVSEHVLTSCGLALNAAPIATQAVPTGGFLAESFSPGDGELVKLGAAIVIEMPIRIRAAPGAQGGSAQGIGRLALPRARRG